MATPSRSFPSPIGRSAIVDKRDPAAVVEALAACDLPLIGAINGAAASAVFGLSLCMDTRIASDQARMGSIFIKRGLRRRAILGSLHNRLDPQMELEWTRQVKLLGTSDAKEGFKAFLEQRPPVFKGC